MKRLQEMGPSFSAHDIADQGLRDTVLLSKSALRLPCFGSETNGAYIRVRKLGLGMVFTLDPFRMQTEPVAVSQIASHTLRVVLRKAPMLATHINSVVLRSPEEQVVRADARWVVALMEYPEAIRDRAIVDLPRDTMSAERSVVESELAIPVGPTIARPNPALTKLGRVFWNRPVLVGSGPKSHVNRGAAKLAFRHRRLLRCLTLPDVCASRGHFAAFILPEGEVV